MFNHKPYIRVIYDTSKNKNDRNSVEKVIVSNKNVKGVNGTRDFENGPIRNKYRRVRDRLLGLYNIKVKR